VYHKAAMRRLLLACVIVTIAAAVAVVGGCVEKEPEKIDEGFIRENTLSAAPTPKHPVNADLAGKIIYLGCDVDKEVIVRGTNLKITHYWKVVQAPGTEWRVFTHVEGTIKDDWLNVDQTKLRSMYGADKWKAGDILRDEQIVPVGKTWTSPNAIIYIGLYRKGAHGEAGRMAVVSGPSDGKNRVRVLTLPVTDSARPAGPDYVIRRATGKITIDGKGDEPDWVNAPATEPFKVAQGGQPVDGQATAKMLWDDEHLYVLVTIADKDVASQYTKHDEPIWKEDAAELFIDADKNGAGYVELQVSPRNVTFDSWFEKGRAAGGDEKWESKMVTAVVVDGTLDSRDDADKGWTAEMAIPLEAVKGRDAAMAVRLPPKLGDTWRLNFVRVEKPKDKNLSASSWADITIQDFHAIDRLKLVAFGDDKGQTTAPAPAAAVPAAGPPPAAPKAPPAKPKKKDK
jgi:hypothetical protein